MESPRPRLARTLGTAGKIPLLAGVLRWLARLYRDGSEVRILSGYARGLRWRRYRRYVSGYWLGQYELPVQKMIAATLRPGDVFFDVGAQAGFFSLIAARRVGRGGLCVAFDPDPLNAASMSDQARLNHFSHWTIVAAAVAEAAGEQLFLRPPPGASTGRLAADGDRGPGLTVPVVTLDEAARRFRPPTLVKVDVEGAEERVLRGAARVLAEVRPIWLIELHGPPGAAAVRSILAAAGYRLRHLDGTPIAAGDPLPAHLAAYPEQMP